MSFLSSLFSWAKNSGVLAEAQKEAAEQAAVLIQQAVSHCTATAPDMAPAIEAAAQQMLTAHGFGLATQAK